MSKTRRMNHGSLTMVGLVCALVAQGCAGSDQAQDDVALTRGELKARGSSSGNLLIYPWPTQRLITYCVAPVGGSAPNFPNTTFRNLIVSTYANAGIQWSDAGDVWFSHAISQDGSCSGTNSNVELNIVYVSDVNVVAAGQASTDLGWPDLPKPRTLRIGQQVTGPNADYTGQAEHEFGHALGFAHEFDKASTNILLTGADPGSIMDYPPGGFTGLTRLDRVGIEHAYGLPFVSLGIPAGVTLAGKPAISTWGSNHFDVFARGTNNQLYWTKSDNNGATWTPWQSLGGSIADAPAAISWGVNRIDVVARGTGNDLQHIYFNGTWHAWDPSLGGILSSSVGVSSWAAGRLDVFYRSPANELHHRWYSNGWSPTDDNWHGSIVSSPAAVSWGPNRIDIVARGAANDVQHFYFASAPGQWESLGGVIDQDPGISSWGANRLDVFARNSNKNLFNIYYNNGWPTWPPSWENLKGHHGSGPAPVAFNGLPGQIDLVILGDAGDVELTHRDPADGAYKVNH
ncbi:MAG: hypothetical protein JWM82_766 [Myxococcales bacterium]|nr:hypothetical protein [Myxococcales bacterium]